MSTPNSPACDVANSLHRLAAGVAILLGVDFSGDPAVLSSQQPGASTWAMLLVGFVGLGFVGYRTSRGAASIAA